MRLVDACDILGVPMTATRDEGQRAYRKCASLRIADATHLRAFG